jgi:hypothetical protein
MNKNGRHTIRISQDNIGPSRKVEWFCRCEGYSLTATGGFNLDPGKVTNPVFRNKIEVNHHGCDIIKTNCGRCGREWTVYVYQRKVG